MTRRGAARVLAAAAVVVAVVSLAVVLAPVAGRVWTADGLPGDRLHFGDLLIAGLGGGSLLLYLVTSVLVTVFFGRPRAACSARQRAGVRAGVLAGRVDSRPRLWMRLGRGREGRRPAGVPRPAAASTAV